MGLRARERLLAAFRRDLALTVGGSLILIVAAFALAYRYVKPAPPRTLVIAAPSDEGGARYFARRYKEILARYGVTLDVRETQGTAASLALLADEDSEVEAAFVQGGVEPAKKGWPIYSLASLAYMPVWLLYREPSSGEAAAPAIDDPIALRGMRVSVGPPRSGTNQLARALLDENKVREAPTVLLELDTEQAAAKLVSGEIDALFAVAPAESPAIRKLCTTPGFRLVSFARAEAYTRKLPYLKALSLPRGVYDLATDRPPTDVKLVATTSNLVVSEGLHPALAYLLLRAATEVHSSAGILDKEREFPVMVGGSFPPTDESQRYFTQGAPLLQRYLPFWAANLVERLWVMLLPIVAVVLPVVRMVPPFVEWRSRRRVWRWYALLKRLEVELDSAPPPDMEQLERMLAQLDELDGSIRALAIPLPYSENLYAFRGHVDFVRQRIRLRLAR